MGSHVLKISRHNYGKTELSYIGDSLRWRRDQGGAVHIENVSWFLRTKIVEIEIDEIRYPRHNERVNHSYNMGDMLSAAREQGKRRK